MTDDGEQVLFRRDFATAHAHERRVGIEIEWTLHFTLSERSCVDSLRETFCNKVDRHSGGGKLQQAPFPLDHAGSQGVVAATHRLHGAMKGLSIERAADAEGDEEIGGRIIRGKTAQRDVPLLLPPEWSGFAALPFLQDDGA
jgi:hypothetical protein